MFKLLAPSAKHACVRVASSLSTLFAIVILAGALPCRADSTLFFSGDLRSNATVTDCGTWCVLDSSFSDSDYAQWAAVVNTFNVTDTSTMTAISYSFGGGESLTGAMVAAGGLEPYLSLFDSGGNFLASTYLATTCPAGANTYDGHCYDVSLDGGTLTAGTYYIALTAYPNMSRAENLGDGTTLAGGFTGLGGLALDEDLHYGYDVVLTSTNPTSPSPVPEPNFSLLVGISLAPLFFLKGMKRRADTHA